MPVKKHWKKQFTVAQPDFSRGLIPACRIMCAGDGSLSSVLQGGREVDRIGGMGGGDQSVVVMGMVNRNGAACAVFYVRKECAANDSMGELARRGSRCLP